MLSADSNFQLRAIAKPNRKTIYIPTKRCRVHGRKPEELVFNSEKQLSQPIGVHQVPSNHFLHILLIQSMTALAATSAWLSGSKGATTRL